MSEQTYEMKPGQFQLFKVDPEKKTKDSYPDFTGKIKLTDEILAAIRAGGDPDLRIAGWGRKSNAGKTYISGTVSVDKPRDSAISQSEADDFMTTPALAAASEPGPLEDPNDPGPPDTRKRTVQQTEAASDDLPF